MRGTKCGKKQVVAYLKKRKKRRCKRETDTLGGAWIGRDRAGLTSSGSDF